MRPEHDGARPRRGRPPDRPRVGDGGGRWEFDAGDGDPDTWDDRPPGELDDQDDRQELRRRYYGLLQELRVLLPGCRCSSPSS